MKDIQVEHIKAKQALSRATARASQRQRQQLMVGATSTSGGQAQSAAKAASTAQSITVGAPRKSKISHVCRKQHWTCSCFSFVLHAA
jgi:hypothetical protein